VTSSEYAFTAGAQIESILRLVTVSTAAGQTTVSYTGQFLTCLTGKVSPEAATEHLAALESALRGRRQMTERVLTAVELVANASLAGASPIAAMNMLRLLSERLASA